MKNYTDINIIVDRSGSMSSIATDMLGGLRTFIKTQKERKDQAKVSFYLFDDQYDTIFQEKDLSDVSDEDFALIPRGWTALVDAIGTTINSVGERLSKIAEADRPNRVLLLIITDGADNRSREFKLAKVKEMVQHQRDVYAWDFVFLGANIDSFATGGGLGIVGSSTRDFAPTTKGVREAFIGLNSNYASYSILNREQDRGSTFDWNTAKAEQKAKEEANNAAVPVTQNS